MIELYDSPELDPPVNRLSCEDLITQTQGEAVRIIKEAEANRLLMVHNDMIITDMVSRDRHGRLIPTGWVGAEDQSWTDTIPGFAAGLSPLARRTKDDPNFTLHWRYTGFKIEFVAMHDGTVQSHDRFFDLARVLLPRLVYGHPFLPARQLCVKPLLWGEKDEIVTNNWLNRAFRRQS